LRSLWAAPIANASPIEYPFLDGLRRFVTGKLAAHRCLASRNHGAFRLPAVPLVGFVHGGSADAMADFAAAFRKGLGEAGYAEGQNVTVEYHWLNGQFDRLPALIADLVSRRVALIATLGSAPAAIGRPLATPSRKHI